MNNFRHTLLQPGVDLRPTHSDRLSRWLGAPMVEKLSRDMRGWYGPPIALQGVPGAVFATGDGDFIGRVLCGAEASRYDKAADILWRARQRLRTGLQRGWRASGRFHPATLHGFTSLSDLINEATVGGKRYEYQYSKVGPTGVANVTSSLFRLGNQPAAGTGPGNAPGGTAFVDSTTGGHLFTNPTSGDTQHIVSGNGIATVAGNNLLLYDLIFGVNKTMASTGTEAVTGVPTRYQNQTGGTADYIGGNFLAIHVGGTALAATGHNWTVCTYNDQGGASSTLPSVTGNASAIVDRLDQPTNQWYCPLETGDVGIKALTQMQCSASVATGVIWFMLGHPIAWMTFPVANQLTPADYVQTAFNLTRIFDDACLAQLEVNKPSSTATTYNVQYSAVAG